MARKKIMVVDDEPDYAQLMADYFKSQGYEVITANNMSGALAFFQKERPGVVLLDYHMPVMTGEKLLPLLQRVDPLVRVIVITGVLADEVEEQFKGLGYFAFFKKGDLSLEKVKEKIEEAFGY